MKTGSLVLVIMLAAVGAGCSTTERSRSLANPAVPGKVLAVQVCSNCHGLDGNSVSPNFPKLSGQPEEYLVAQLTEFRNHDRADPAGFEYMWGLSRSLSDGQIKELANYFSGQKNIPDQPVPGKDMADGKIVFEQGVPDKSIPPCSSCHGPQGAGNGAFPRIAGQHADYLVKQLKVFQRTHERPAGVAMEAITHDLTDRSMIDVAAYLSGLASN